MLFEIVNAELRSLAYDPDFVAQPDLIAVRRDLCKALQLIDAALDLPDLRTYRSIHLVQSIDSGECELVIADGVHLDIRVEPRQPQPVVLVVGIELHSKVVTR